jgi:hypothetical protein
MVMPMQQTASAESNSIIAVRNVAPRERRPIALLGHRAFRGCNVYHTTTVFRQRVDLAAIAGVETTDVDASLATRLARRFIELDELSPGGRTAEAFRSRLRSARGMRVEEALLEAILAVERSMAAAMGRPDTFDFAQIVPGAAETIDLVWATRAPSVSRAAARIGFAALAELLPEPLRPRSTGQSVEALLEALRKRAKRRQWCPSVALLARDAESRGVPFEALGDAYLLFGHGAEQQVVYAPRSKVSAESRAARIPIALVAGNRGSSLIAVDLEGLLRAAGKGVGLAAPKRAAVCGEPLPAHAPERRDTARFLLRDPRVGVLVAATSPRRIVRRGLRVERCSVAAIADAAPARDLEAFRRGVEVVLTATTGFVVIDAANAAAVAATAAVDRARIVLCARRENEAVRQHAALGGPVVVRTTRDGAEHIELRSAGAVLAAAPVSSVRSGAGGRRRRRVRARMFAIAMAFGLGLSAQEIATAVERRRYLQP